MDQNKPSNSEWIEEERTRRIVGFIGGYLVEDGAVTLADLDRGLDMQLRLAAQGRHVRLGQVLIEMGIITAEQLEHAEWAGFHFYDLIFPLFMFISGIAIPFAVETKLEKSIPARRLVRKVITRFLILVFLGILYNGALEHGFANARYASVLGQIGFGYLFASLIVIFVRSVRIRLFWLAGILLFVTLVQLLVPVPGIGAGVLTPEGCINGYIDRAILPGKLYGGMFDPEGLLCNVSAIAITLMGSFAGNILRNRQTGSWKKMAWLSVTGAVLIITALLAGIAAGLRNTG